MFYFQSGTVTNVLSSSIYSLAIHPSESKIMVCAGDKRGSIGFWNVKEQKESTRNTKAVKDKRRSSCVVPISKKDHESDTSDFDDESEDESEVESEDDSGSDYEDEMSLNQEVEIIEVIFPPLISSLVFL